MPRIDRETHRRVAGDTPDPEQRDRGEPERHDGAERPADPRRPLGLDGEQRHEDQDRHRKHIGCEGRKHDVQPLQRRKYGNCRGDRPIAVDQRRAEQTEGYDDRAMLALYPEQ